MNSNIATTTGTDFIVSRNAANKEIVPYDRRQNYYFVVFYFRNKLSHNLIVIDRHYVVEY